MLIPQAVFGICKLCDPSSSRYSLGGVKLERDAKGKPVAIATEGKRLLAVEWDEDKTDEYPSGVCDVSPVKGFATVVPQKQWKEAEKLPLRKSPKPILLNVALDEHLKEGKDTKKKVFPERIVMGATDLETARTIKVAPLEGAYPKWRSILPEYLPHEVAVVIMDAKMLSELLAVIADGLSHPATHSVAIHVPLDPEKPILLKASEDGKRTTGVMMPLAPDNYANTSAKKARESEELAEARAKASANGVHASDMTDYLLSIMGPAQLMAFNCWCHNNCAKPSAEDEKGAA